MVGSVRDERGAVAVQFAILLPVLLITVIGAFEVWKILHMQQVLNDAAYQGVRLLCMQPDHRDAEGDRDMPQRVEKLVRRYVSTANFVDPALRDNPENGSLLQVGITDTSLECGAPVSVRVRLHWTVGQDWAGTPSASWFPFERQRRWLIGEATGSVLCR